MKSFLCNNRSTSIQIVCKSKLFEDRDWANTRAENLKQKYRSIPYIFETGRVHSTGSGGRGLLWGAQCPLLATLRGTQENENAEERERVGEGSVAYECLRRAIDRVLLHFLAHVRVLDDRLPFTGHVAAARCCSAVLC